MSEPKWLTIAKAEIGTREMKGAFHNQRIIHYHSKTTLRATTDEVPWCSAFACWVMEKAGYLSTKSAAARSWLHYGESLEVPELGCIVVFKRGTNPTSGHVAFVVEDLGANLRVLGGNQGDEVKYSIYPKKDVLGYRWPSEGATA